MLEYKRQLVETTYYYKCSGCGYRIKLSERPKLFSRKCPKCVKGEMTPSAVDRYDVVKVPVLEEINEEKIKAWNSQDVPLFISVCLET